MKQFALIFAVLCAACTIAVAGPERMQSSGKEVMPQPVVETTCFEGFYFGIHAGGAIVGNTDTRAESAEESLGARGNGFVEAFARDSSSITTGQGGVHMGYNWVHGDWAFGLELDVSGTGLSTDQHALALAILPNGPPFGTEIKSESDINVYGTVRPRFGRVVGNAFIYVTGGLAVGNTELDSHSELFASTSEGGDVFAESNASDDEIRLGWTAGAGVDICLTHRIILNFTYLYTDLADSSVSHEFHEVSGPVEVGVRTYDAITRASSGNNFHTVRVGLSFGF